MESLGHLGIAGLFAASFLAATVLPFSSEVFLGLLIVQGRDPALCVSVATAGNVLGALVNYIVGFHGSLLVVRKVLRVSEREFFRAVERLRAWGTWSLFFAWVPVLGDPLTLAAGVLRVRIPLFLLLVTAGKLMRYVVLVWALVP